MIRFLIPDLSLQGVTLGVFTLMYLLLVILMTRCFLNEVYLIIFSYSKCITHLFHTAPKVHFLSQKLQNLNKTHQRLMMGDLLS